MMIRIQADNQHRFRDDPWTLVFHFFKRHAKRAWGFFDASKPCVSIFHPWFALEVPGWFSIHETNQDTYRQGKLKKLLVRDTQGWWQQGLVWKSLFILLAFLQVSISWWHLFMPQNANYIQYIWRHFCMHLPSMTSWSVDWSFRNW